MADEPSASSAEISCQRRAYLPTVSVLACLVMIAMIGNGMYGGNILAYVSGRSSLMQTGLLSDMLHFKDTSRRHLRELLQHKLKLEYGEEKVDGRQDITECTKSITSGDRDFDRDQPISAGMQKLIITCAKSKLAKQADEELQFGLSSIGPKARQMLVLRPAGELQQIMLKEDELRQAMLRREKQMKAAEHAIKQHQLLVAEMATDHSTQSGPGSVGGSGSVKKAQSARSWLERARQASDLSAQGALKKMTAAQLRKQLATIEALLRRGVKDGLVAPRDGHISAPPKSGIEEARPKVAGQNPKTDSNREGFEGPGRASTGAQVSSAGSRRPARAELAQTSPATLETGGSAGKEIKMASALDRAARSVVASMGKTNQALTSSLARRVQALTREEARGLRQVQQAELEEKQVLPHGLSHAIQMRRRDEDEATRLQRLRTAELQSEPDTDEVGQ